MNKIWVPTLFRSHKQGWTLAMNVMSKKRSVEEQAVEKALTVLSSSQRIWEAGHTRRKEVTFQCLLCDRNEALRFI